MARARRVEDCSQAHPRRGGGGRRRRGFAQGCHLGLRRVHVVARRHGAPRALPRLRPAFTMHPDFVG
eukprot:9013688-Lingulodinium_polyedra.AAC.1